MIYDFENKKFIKRLTISEHKTGKINIIPINDNLSIALQKFFPNRILNTTITYLQNRQTTQDR